MRARQTFSIGPDLPVTTLEDLGISASHFEDPEILARQLLQDPNEAFQMAKLFKKMIFTGGASRILPHGLNSLIFRKKIISMPGFIVYTKNKARYVNNLSKRPYFPAGRNHILKCGSRLKEFSATTIPSSVRNFTLNKGYLPSQTTMGFHGIADKAVSLLALPSTSFNINVDLKGWFFQIPQNRKMLHYQVKTFPVPETDDPNGPVSLHSFVLMGTEMGNAIAAAAAGGANIAIVRAIDREAQYLPYPDLLSLPKSKIIPPGAYNLRECKASYQEIMARYPTKHKNEDAWLHLDHTHLAIWRSGANRFPLYSIHQDDVALKNISRSLTIQAGRYLYAEYQQCNILTSTTFSEDDVLQEDIITGTKVNFRTKTLSLPDDKWLRYTHNVHNLILCAESVTAAEALTICGQVMHATELFPSLKPSFTPFSWFLSGLCTLCKADPRKWERAKARRIAIPPVIARMVHDGWKMIKNRAQHATKFVKILEDADRSISTDWCPRGMGFVDHISGDFEGILIPTDHPMTIFFAKHSLFGELFIVTLALIVFAKPGQVIALAEDNMGCIQAIKKYRSRASYSALSMKFAEVVREKQLTIIPRYMDTDTIPADPISRTDKKGWSLRFSERCKKLKIPKGRRLFGALNGWTDLWNDIMIIERKYSLLS
mgnify:CR=1 FL=1